MRSLYDAAPWALLADYAIARPDDHIAELDSRLPPAFTEGCIEVPLVADHGGADLWGTIPYDAGGRVACSRYLRRNAPAVTPPCASLRRILTDWVTPRGDAHALIGDLFLEFDLRGAVQTPEPIVVASLMGPPSDAASALRAIGCYLGLARGCRPRIDSRLRATMDALPSSAAVRNVASMRRDGRLHTRVSIWMNVLAIQRLLRLLETDVSMVQVRDILRCVPNSVPSVGVQIDVGRSDTLGLEVALAPQMRNPSSFKRLLDALQCESACGADRRELVERWIEADGLANVHRNLIVKINCSHDAPIRAKGYFIFSPVD